MFEGFSKIELWVVQLMLGVGIAILVIIVGYLLDIRPLEISLDNRWQQIVLLEKEIQKSRSRVNDNKTEDLKASSYSSFGQINVMSFLERAMFETDMQPKLLEPKSKIEDNEFSTHLVKLEFEGGYRNFLLFLNKILGGRYLIVIDEIDLKKIAIATKELRIRMVITIYQNKFMEYDVAKDFYMPGLAVDSRDIFNHEEIKRSLDLWQSSELRFIGVIKKGRVVFGVVADPIGRVYQVGIGDQIGSGRSKVLIIDKCKITMTNQKDNISRGGKCI